jgi:hypothetical protein
MTSASAWRQRKSLGVGIGMPLALDLEPGAVGQLTGLGTQRLGLVGGGFAGGVASEPFLAGLEELLRPSSPRPRSAASWPAGCPEHPPPHSAEPVDLPSFKHGVATLLPSHHPSAAVYLPERRYRHSLRRHGGRRRLFREARVRTKTGKTLSVPQLTHCVNAKRSLALGHRSDGTKHLSASQKPQNCAILSHSLPTVVIG